MITDHLKSSQKGNKKAYYIWRDNDKMIQTPPLSSSSEKKTRGHTVIKKNFFNQEKHRQLEILYHKTISFESKGEKRAFSNKQKLREFVTSTSGQPEILKEVSHRE